MSSLDYVRSFLQPYLLLSLLLFTVTLDLGTSLSGKQFADSVYLPWVPKCERARARVRLLWLLSHCCSSLVPAPSAPSLVFGWGSRGQHRGVLSSQCGSAPSPGALRRGRAPAPRAPSRCPHPPHRPRQRGTALAPTPSPPSWSHWNIHRRALPKAGELPDTLPSSSEPPLCEVIPL